MQKRIHVTLLHLNPQILENELEMYTFNEFNDGF